MRIAATIQEPAEGLIFQGKKSVEPILRTENLWKLYRAGKVEVPALRGVNFEVTKLRRHKIGFVFQRFNLLPTLTAKGNIAIAQFIHGDGFDPHRFDVVTQMLGLAGRLHHKPSELSGGEQQRVAIARAIINEPKILLADEPTGNLDSKNSEIVLQMLRQLNKDLGQTIVMITHNPEATTYFDRVVHMRDGVIVDGVPAD